MMTREEILSEIRRTASENGGKPLGRAVHRGVHAAYLADIRDQPDVWLQLT